MKKSKNKETINEEILKTFAVSLYEKLENASDVLEHFDEHSVALEMLQEIHEIRTAIKRENKKNNTNVLK